MSIPKETIHIIFNYLSHALISKEDLLLLPNNNRIVKERVRFSKLPFIIDEGCKRHGSSSKLDFRLTWDRRKLSQAIKDWPKKPLKELTKDFLHIIAPEFRCDHDDFCSAPVSHKTQNSSSMFHVIGGYGMDLSHKYINQEFLEQGFKFRHVVANGEGHLYSVDDNVSTRRRGGEKRWEDVAKVPDDIWLKECVVTWKDKMLVIGSGRTICGPSYTYLLRVMNGVRTDSIDRCLEDCRFEL
ncbi:hypothetical protein V2J09_005440 [Rumex salicifolius]